MICLVDNTEHPDLEALHKHLQFKLKMRQDAYYTDFAPQRDLCTGEAIPFKAPATRYLKTEFVHKRNLKKWIKTEPDKAKAWSINWLKQRKEEKGLVYPPTQVELRSLMTPTAVYFDSIGGYQNICRELGYTVRFQDLVPDSKPLQCPVIVDTREQKPLKLKVPTEKGTLTYGDYGLPAEYSQGVYIERKSLADFAGTLSDRETRPGDSSFKRFVRELERAQELGAYVVMLVESDINDALGLGYNGVPTYGKINSDHLFHNLRELLHRFSDFQALFVVGRVEAATAVAKLLSMGEGVKTLDLELAYETGRLVFV